MKNLKFESNRRQWEMAVKYDKKHIANTTEAINDYQKALSSMSANKLSSPSYVSDFGDTPKGTTPLGYFYYDLVAPSFKGARELVRLNKSYFDKSISKGIPQLIVIEFNDGGRFGTSYMKKTAKVWFNQIDYGKLQAMVK